MADNWPPEEARTQPRPVSMPISADYDMTDRSPPEPPPVSSSRLFSRKSLSRPTELQTSPSMPIHIPSTSSVIPGNNLPSAPASPLTPAPSPSLGIRAPDWSTASVHEDLGDVSDQDSHNDIPGNSSAYGLARRPSKRDKGGLGLGYRHIRHMFADMDTEERKRMLAELLNMCDGKLLGFVANFVAPRLKRDPFEILPVELCLRVLTFVDDARTLARSSQVSKKWRELVGDDMAWKSLCEKHAYRRMSDESHSTANPRASLAGQYQQQQQQPVSRIQAPTLPSHFMGGPRPIAIPPSLANPHTEMVRSKSLDRAMSIPDLHSHDKNPRQGMTYYSHFKQRYQVETAWRMGGSVTSCQISPDQGVVTSLHLTDKYIIVALDNAKIHIFNTEGRHQRCLTGHTMGVWAMVPSGDTLVSGGCDRDVRVWDMATGKAKHMLRGHTSTVRCIKMCNATTAISGSRDTTLRIWDIEAGICKHILIGHQSSVRCIDIHGDIVVSGSYDTFARVWSISEGRCLRTLQGHFSQIYTIGFDGRRIVTGSLDTSVRVWNAFDGRCIAVLQGHTSLVGQLQLRGNTLVTGGSDGSVRVWSLETYTAIHRLAAHDNSVTSLQFDDSRIVSGGSDGRVKVWDLAKGNLIRELGQPADAVRAAVFEEERAVILTSRHDRPTGLDKTFMEVWSFKPPPEPAGRGTEPLAGAAASVAGPSRSRENRHQSTQSVDVIMGNNTPLGDQSRRERHGGGLNGEQAG